MIKVVAGTCDNQKR